MSSGDELVLDRSVGGDGGGRLTVSGTVDVLTGDQFERALTDALNDPAAKIGLLVDLGGLRFLDSHGISMLMAAHRVAGERDIPFAVINARGVVREILTMVGMYDVLVGPAAPPAT